MSNEQLSGPSIRIDRSMIAAKLDESLTTVIRFSIAIHRLLVEFRDLQQAARGAGKRGKNRTNNSKKKTTPITIKTEVLVEPRAHLSHRILIHRKFVVIRGTGCEPFPKDATAAAEKAGKKLNREWEWTDRSDRSRSVPIGREAE